MDALPVRNGVLELVYSCCLMESEELERNHGESKPFS